MVHVSTFLDVVRSFIGVPVHRRGDSRAGVDCAGLVVAALRECGIPCQHGQVYGDLPDPGTLVEGLRCVADQCDEPAPFLGALVQLYVGRQPRHVAVVTGVMAETLITHSWFKAQRVCETVLHLRVASVWRLREVTYG